MTPPQPQHPQAAAPAEDSIAGRFAVVAALHARRIAVSAAGKDWTYAELDGRSDAIARFVLETGTTAPVALLMAHDAPLIAAILGVAKAGRIYVALDPSDPVPRLKELLAEAGAELVLTDRAHRVLAESLESSRIRLCEEIPDAPVSSNITIPAVPPNAGAWLMFTSGSTGKPKGVWQNQRGVVHQADVYAEIAEITAADRLSLLTPCHLAASTSALFTALLKGATVCPFASQEQGVDRLAQWLREKRVSVYHSVPTVFRALLRTEASAELLGSMRLIRLGGEPLFRADLNAFQQRFRGGTRLMHALSSTETGLISASILDLQTSCPSDRIPVGRPVPGVEVSLVDEQNRPVQPGCEGRILVRGEYLAQGYWRQSDAAEFQADPSDASKRIFVSGDLGCFLTDGSIEHRGRMDHQVKVRGRRLNLLEVEAALRATGLCSDAAAITRDDSGDSRLVAFVVACNGDAASAEIFRRALRGLVPAHLIPDQFVPVRQLPQTAGGKLDRRALPTTAPRGRTSGPSTRDGIEAKVAAIWESVLNTPAIGRKENFFDLGGTSIQSAQVLSRIEAKFGLALSPSALAEHSTVEALAAAVAGNIIHQSASPMILMRGCSRGTPLFLLHNGKGDISAYGQLARRIQDRPVYGFQAIGLSGEAWPLMTVPAMAKRYLAELLAVSPDGRCLLAGTCVGGFVALEMAQELLRSGRRPELVAILGSPAAPDFDRRSGLGRFAVEMRDYLRILRWTLLRKTGLSQGPNWLPAYRRFVTHMNIRARRAYQPAPYNGTLTLITASDRRSEAADPRFYAGRYAREVRDVALPCRRKEMFLPPGVDQLARELQPLMEASDRAVRP